VVRETGHVERAMAVNVNRVDVHTGEREKEFHHTRVPIPGSKVKRGAEIDITDRPRGTERHQLVTDRGCPRLPSGALGHGGVVHRSPI